MGQEVHRHLRRTVRGQTYELLARVWNSWVARHPSRSASTCRSAPAPRCAASAGPGPPPRAPRPDARDRGRAPSRRPAGSPRRPVRPPRPSTRTGRCPGEVRPCAALEHKAESGGPVRPDGQPAAVVTGRHDPDHQVVDAYDVPGATSVSRRRPSRRSPAPGPGHARHQQAGARGQAGQRGHMQMVGVQMRDQHDVRDAGLGRGGPRGACADVRDGARTADRSDPRTGVLDRAGGVTPPCDLHRHSIASFVRLPSSLRAGSGRRRNPEVRGPHGRCVRYLRPARRL